MWAKYFHQAIPNLYDVRKNKTFNKKDAALMKKKIQPIGIGSHQTEIY
ncbi:MAG: hypothetical protein R2847_06855 [Bacteroidia bacterium]